MNVKEKIKQKWNIQTDRDFWLIMLVFSLAGISIGTIRRIIFPLIGIHASTHLWIKILAYIPLCPPVYMLGTLFWGWLFGQNWFFMPRVQRRIDFILRRKALNKQ